MKRYTVAEMREGADWQKAPTDPSIDPHDGWVATERLAHMLEQIGVRRLNMSTEHARHLSLGDRMAVDEDDERSFVVVKIGASFDKDDSRLTPVFFVALDAFEESMSDQIAELSALLKEANAHVTFDRHRSITLPCYRCNTTTEPRDLVTIGHYALPFGGNLQPGDRIVRPLCKRCVRDTALEATAP